MSPHGALRLSGVAGDDRLDDGRVLGDGGSGAARDEDRAVLVAHRLGVQALDETHGGRVAGELEQRGVQLGVHLRRAEEVARLEELALTGDAAVETSSACLVDALGGLPDGEAFENRASLQDLDGLVVRDAPDACAPMRLADDEPVLLEADERGAHGAARHRECRREVGFDEAGIRREVTADDGRAEGVVARGDRHRSAILRNVAKIVNNSVFMSAVERTAQAVAVLGLGEAGSRLAADLAAAGVEVRGYDPDPDRDVPSIARARDAASAATGSDVVLSVNSARAALDAATEVLPALRESTIYADLNTASPDLKRELAALVAEAGLPFVDVALLGPIPQQGLRAPVLASGAGAPAFAELFEPLGMPVDVLSERAGDAAALKLVRSVFMKGLAAAVVESMQAAEIAGHADWLAKEIAGMIGRPYLARALEGSRKHAARRVAEMEAARDLLVELGVEPRIASASAAQLAELASDRREVRT